MRNIFISVLALFITACANYDFVPTPVPEEIHTLIYTTKSSAGSKTWQLTNNNLKVKITTKASNGQVLSSKTTKSNKNDFNWVAYNLEQAKFTKSKSVPGNGSAQASEVLTIATQGETYTYTQNSSSRFPAGIQKVTSVIPQLFR